MSSADAVARPSTSVWRAWLQMARISNTPTTVSNTVAGAVLVSTTAAAGTVAVVAVAIALFYTAGMILNDVFDEAIDRRERPERPLPSGRVSHQAALLAVVVLFVAGELLLALEGWRPVVAGLGLIGLIVLYDAWHKGNALSPLLMAACRLMVYVIAGLAVASALNTELWGAAALLFLYIVGLTQVAKAEGGGIAARWPVLAVLAPAAYWAKELPDLAVALLIAAFLLWAGYALWLVLARRRIGAGVVRLIAGIAIYDALAVAGAGGGAAALGVCLVAFLATIALQTKIAGT
jgi:heme O synthase-like polyprenyltransferase